MVKMKKVILILMAIMIFGCIGVSANSLPSDWVKPTHDASWTHELVYYNPDTNLFYFCYSQEPFFLYDSSSITFIDSAYQINRKTSTNGYTWQNGEVVAGSSQIILGNKEILYATADIVNVNTGVVFFSPPPPPTPTPTPLQPLYQVQTQSLGNLMTAFGDNLGVLLRVGVIILCLILGLYLIPRLLRSFL